MRKITNDHKNEAVIEVMYCICQLNTYDPKDNTPRLSLDYYQSCYSVEKIKERANDIAVVLLEKDVDFISHPILKDSSLTNEDVLKYLEKTYNTLMLYLESL